MATAQSSQADEPPYQSYRELRSDHLPVSFSPDGAQRLFWPFDGVFPTAISVMKTPHSPDSLEPYFQPDTGVSGSGTWHEIAQLPLTKPKVSSVVASVYDLEQWEQAWLEWHREHTAGDAQYVTYGDLSDEDRPYPSEMKEDGGWESDSDTEFLVRCCGDDRPLRKAAKLIVKPSAGKDFVTVHDYVSAVYPWLMSLRGDILKAKTVMLGYSPSLPTEFIVIIGPNIMIKEKEDWIRRLRGDLPPNLLPSDLKILERIRASRNR